jgi:hypothetical protein
MNMDHCTLGLGEAQTHGLFSMLHVLENELSLFTERIKNKQQRGGRPRWLSDCPWGGWVRGVAGEGALKHRTLPPLSPRQGEGKGQCGVRTQ